MTTDYQPGDWLQYADAPQEDIDDYLAIADADEETAPPAIGDAGCWLPFGAMFLFSIILPLFALLVLLQEPGV